MIRALVIEQLDEDYVRTAYAKGASATRILWRHIGRTSPRSIVTMLGLDIGVALGGAFFVETVFGLPGLGYVGLSSIQNLDYPLTVGTLTSRRDRRGDCEHCGRPGARRARPARA